ncbi:hypothetical protein K0504_09910 [Neiella marina]|uniref:Uncharacterized protein n=1 Tax=Neiella holothuriorum TaxID=2870530 RepID=A0ABS7EG85_9GAMM|nr:hypothetical protein [Neiella holothuriorum]MBW8191352.1 hypothetical protein [Neiella holothuriorum]
MVGAVNAYAGIGARATPAPILNIMTELGRLLAYKGVVLRSGAANGADSAFESGCDQYCQSANVAPDQQKQIFLPWNNFNNRNTTESGVLHHDLKTAQFLARRYHKSWRHLNAQSRLLMARNSLQILGCDLRQYARFVICWTPDGSLTGRDRKSGGTGQALRIAYAYNIPVYNLYRDDHLQLAHNWLKTTD